MELPPYLRLEQSDDIETPSDVQTSSDNSGSIDGSVSNPLHTRGGTSSSGHSFILRVLNKESKVEITTLTASSTVSDLKSAICKHTQIPELNQRLIFSGKHLNPDNKQLREFNICSESSIHLFPRPTAAPIPQAADDSSVGITRILRVHRMSQPSQEGNLAGYDQGTALSVGLHQTVPEVRLWCYILFFYSFMTLFSHISFIANTGTLGRSILDGFVNTLETIFAACGVYVSHMGLKATQTIDRDDAKKYVQMLMALAACVILSRILWIIDMIVQMKIGIREAEKEESEADAGQENNKHDDPYSTDDYYGGPRKLDPATMLFYFSVQVVIMAFIYSSMWIFCVTRAVRFRAVVEDQSPHQSQASTTV